MNRRSHRTFGMVALVLASALGHLFSLPSQIEPVAWVPPPRTPLEGVYARNDRLKEVEWWARELVGPEAITFDAEGRLVTGLLDGRIVRLSVGSDVYTELANTAGRPLALAYDTGGRLIICDARAGLLALRRDGRLEVLSTQEGGLPFRFVDDLAITESGIIYFTDASARHRFDGFELDLMEHQTTGRILRYDPATRRTTRVADGFSFANGLALGPGERYLVMAETGTYRLWRIWLDGPRAGEREIFVDALPGFPDNVRYSPNRKVFWVAIGTPRIWSVDALAGWPALRGLIIRLPKALHPAPTRHAFVVAIDESGRAVESLQHDAPDSYSPIASAVEHEGFLYLGSFAREGVARLRLTPPLGRPGPR